MFNHFRKYVIDAMAKNKKRNKSNKQMNQRDAYAPLDYLKKYILQKPIYLSTRGSHKTLTKNIPLLLPPLKKKIK